MKRATKVVAILISASLIGLGAAALVGAASDDDIATKIANAKTPADHQEIASYYEQAAADARQRAQRHEKMAKSYQGKPQTIAGMAQHCSNLAKSAKAEALDYDSMAQAHKEMAKSAQ